MVCSTVITRPSLGASHLTVSQGLTEEQITDIFSSAGKVERFRLVYDSETGRPKGFGFADYPDTGTILLYRETPVLVISNHFVQILLLPLCAT